MLALPSRLVRLCLTVRGGYGLCFVLAGYLTCKAEADKHL